MIESLLLCNMSWMKGIARTFCRNRTDAEDLVGETILKVLLNADRFDAGKSFRLWVFVIMRNILRNKMRNIGIVETYWNIPDVIDCGDHSTRSMAGELLSLIEEHAKSSVGIRSVLLYAQGYQYREIADMMGVTVNIVKSRILHGRRRILTLLSGKR